MYSTEIHNGLNEKEIRDFLSMSLVNVFEEECNCKKGQVLNSSGINGLEWAIQDCENDIKFYQKRLGLLKIKDAVVKLIKNNGWEEFDVSDYSLNNTNKKMWMNFIGTDEEYKSFINNNNN